MSGGEIEGGWTPGPWVASNDHSGEGWRIESDAPGYPNDGWVVCPDMFGPDARANAHLIAAAPDMEKALRHLLGGALSLPRFAEEEARAALNKALGK
jgi:hypothetical protein